MCESKYIKVSCKECGVEYNKRKDSIGVWMGYCMPCGRKYTANLPHIKEAVRIRSSGKNSIFWKGGVSTENIRIRASRKYKNWVREILKRDNYVCVICGEVGGALHVHHLMSFSDFPELRFSDTNAETLCIPCHQRTPSWGKNKFTIREQI